MKKTLQMRCLEYERGQPLTEIIQQAVETGTTWEDLAHDLGVSRLTLRRWAGYLGISFATRKRLVMSPTEAPK